MEIAVSMVLLRDEATPTLDAIKKEIDENWPDLQEATDFKESENTLSFSLGTSFVILGTMPAPFPWSDLEGPCQTSILWKNATSELKGHKRHWIVTVSGDLDEVELSALLMRATCAWMATCPEVLGVYWGNATLIVPKAIFTEFAQRVLPLGPPLDVWVDFRVGRDSEKTSSGFTTGMKALGHMEFEAQKSPEPPGELRERFLAQARYVVENGPVINDGDTVGEDADEKIRIVFSPSLFGHEDKVMRLVYEKSSPKKPWWKMW